MRQHHEVVEEYLRRTGWDEPQARSATFASFRRGLTWLDVPVCPEHFAYPARFRELLTKLSKIESRPEAMILDDIVTARASCGPSLTAAPPLIDLHVTLSAEEIAALTHAREHVRVSLVPLHCWGDRDAAMAAIGTVLDAARHAAQRGTGSAP